MQRFKQICLCGAIILGASIVSRGGAAVELHLAKLTPSTLNVQPAAAIERRVPVATERDEAKRAPSLRPTKVKPLGDYPLELKRHRIC